MTSASEAWEIATATPGWWVGVSGGAEVRVDRDGTRWRIARFNSAGWMTLTCRYREISLRSQHPSIAAAKRHVEDILRALKHNRTDTLDAYAQTSSTPGED